MQADNQQTGVNDAAKRREAYQALRAMGYRPQQEVVQESQQAKILRAVYSERQLQEVMTDFWFNHFNVYVQRAPTEPDCVLRARRFDRTSSASSKICSKPRRNTRRCSFTWTTG